MKRGLIGIAAVTSLLTTGAFAADLPMRYAPVFAESIFYWTGFYVGGNIGYSWGSSNDTSTLTDSAGTILFASTSRSDLNGIVGGGQVGYNWQIQSLVWGLEGDIQGTNEKGGRAFLCPSCLPQINLAPAAILPVTVGQKIDWFGTVRGRAGVTVNPMILLYATGGLAYGEVSTHESIGVPAITFSTSTTNVGWTAGGGVEGAIGGNWTARLEYLYLDLGKVNGSFLTPIIASSTGLISSSYSSHITDSIVRLGINYKFNGPVVARY
jgi:outer membrane immunogenic protein